MLHLQAATKLNKQIAQKLWNNFKCNSRFSWHFFIRIESINIKHNFVLVCFSWLEECNLLHVDKQQHQERLSEVASEIVSERPTKRLTRVFARAYCDPCRQGLAAGARAPHGGGTPALWRVVRKMEAAHCPNCQHIPPALYPPQVYEPAQTQIATSRRHLLSR